MRIVPSLLIAAVMVGVAPGVPEASAQTAAEEQCLDGKIARFRRIEGPAKDINFAMLEEWRGECRAPPAAPKLAAPVAAGRLDAAAIGRMAADGVSLFAMPDVALRYRQIMAQGRPLSAVALPEGLPITRADARQAMTLVCQDAACRNTASIVVDLGTGQALVCEKANAGPGDGDAPTTWYRLGQPPVLRRDLTNCPETLAAVPAALFTFGPPRGAQPVGLTIRTPAAGSPERKAMLDAIRPKVVAELGAPLEFRVRTLRVAGKYGFAALDPQRPGGGAIVPAETPMGRKMIASMGSLDIFDCCHAEAILERTAKGWVVLDYGVGATDVWYDGWNKKPLPPGLLAF